MSYTNRYTTSIAIAIYYNYLYDILRMIIYALVKGVSVARSQSLYHVIYPVRSDPHWAFDKNGVILSESQPGSELFAQHS